jgi:amino acid adenylation domain-containing protein
MNRIANDLDLTLQEKRALVARLVREKARGAVDESGLVHRRLEMQAGRTPQTVAIGASSSCLTYAELNARANRLARRLRARGVGPEALVGLHVGRSEAMVVGLLGILKAGGAYVPLDPAYPAERLAFMLDDARVSVLLTEKRLAFSLRRTDAPMLFLDSDDEPSDAESSANLEGGAAAANLAYVIYTSGSTGRPKGVQVTHAALANLLEAMRKFLPICQRDALLAVTTLSFDIAALEILLPLIVGGRVELCDREIAADGARLADCLNATGITFLQATPATWRLLLAAGWRGQSTLQMLCGGEALPRALADSLLGKGAALWNLYGPTETTVWSSAWRVEAGEAPISIGRPIAGTRLYVLDQRLRAVPAGVIGELYIGGAGLARGYRNRPGLTASRFIPDPFGTPPGGRLYRSGDLARWRADGTLECLGRVDHQVKIRGFRVELGEIEAALARHPAVCEAVVAARTDAIGEMSLAAYVVARSDAAPSSPDELRRWLSNLLPAYMVPSKFVTLDSLPLAPNGKVDRQSLPDPGQPSAIDAANVVPHDRPIEAALVEMWGELLGHRRIGARDSFFERGGHSLMAIQLLGRIRRTFEADVPLGSFLEEPTIERLARLIERNLADGSPGERPPVVPVARDGPLPASFAQQRLWFLDQLEPGCASYHIPAAVRLEGRLDVPALELALNEVVRRHEVLRTTLVSDKGVPRQVIVERLDLPLSVRDLSHLPGSRRESQALDWVRQEAERPFDLACGPLVRAGILRLSEHEHVALVTMHHAISDGWSIGILILELAELYGSFLRGEPHSLPALSIQYADYAVWQRSWLEGAAQQAQLDYWTKELAGLPDLELPTDRPRPPIVSQRGGERSITVPGPTLEAVKALAHAEGATLYMALLAAFQVLLHRHSGQVDIAVGSPIAGRTRPELEGLIGLFVNTLVMRCDLSGDPQFRQLLRRVRRKTIQAYAHLELPFDKLVSLAVTNRNASRSPLFQVMFALQNAPLPALQAPELSITPIELAARTSKFDLTLFATELADGLRLTMEYRFDLFDTATVDRLLARYEILLEEIIAHPDRPIGALRMLSDDERKQVLAGCNTAPHNELAEPLDSRKDDDLDSILFEGLPTEALSHE